MKSKTIQIAGVGGVLLERSRRARHVNLSIRPFKGVRVAVPSGVSFDQAEAIAQAKAGWLKKYVERIGRIEKQAAERKALQLIDRRDAKKRLVRRLNELAAKHGFVYNKVSVKCQKTRWGSCSAKNNINLNMNLIGLPEKLIDYAILHELVHTRIKDHSRKFWDELNRYVENAKELDRELSQHHILLLSPPN